MGEGLATCRPLVFFVRLILFGLGRLGSDLRLEIGLKDNPQIVLVSGRDSAGGGSLLDPQKVR